MARFQKGNQIKRIIGAIRHGGAAAWIGILVRVVAPFTSKIAFNLPLDNSLNIQGVKGIIIICPPRSGGTAIYQAISHALPSMPLTNGHAFFLKYGSVIYRKYKKSSRSLPEKFINFNGYTSKLSGVNEGNEFLSWISKNKKDSNRFQKLIQVLDPTTNELVVFKNVRAFDRIFSFYELSHPSQFIIIRVRRDMQKVVESSLNIFQKGGVFHPVPIELINKKITNPERFAVDQITLIEKKIDDQLKKIPENRKLEIIYEEFCEDPYKIIENLAVNYLGFSKKDIRHIPAIDNMRVSKKQKVSEDTANRISELLKNQL